MLYKVLETSKTNLPGLLPDAESYFRNFDSLRIPYYLGETAIAHEFDWEDPCAYKQVPSSSRYQLQLTKAASSADRKAIVEEAYRWFYRATTDVGAAQQALPYPWTAAPNRFDT